MKYSENDERLLEEAKALHYTEWTHASVLEEQAESPEVKEMIRRIERRLYHTEEYYAGML